MNTLNMQMFIKSNYNKIKQNYNLQVKITLEIFHYDMI